MFFSRMKDVQVVSIVDVNENAISKAMKTVEGIDGRLPVFHRDIRRILEDRSIDAVSIATPDHTHALYAIWAMEAGKHVYLEKPVGHNVWEGRQVVKAARKYNRVCQSGLQHRSYSGLQQAIKFLHEGKLGTIKFARVLCYRGSWLGIPRRPDGPVPVGVDWNLWLGPAPEQPFNENRFNYNWRYHWDYANGLACDIGVHHVDIARWGLRRGLARGVRTVGERLGFPEKYGGETPNHQVTALDFYDTQILVEVRALESERFRGVRTGVIFHCERGDLITRANSQATALDPEGKTIAQFSGAGSHFQNFIDAVRSGRKEDLNSDIEGGHLSSTLCQMATISHRLGELQDLDKIRAFPGNEFAVDALGRLKAHLSKNGLDPKRLRARLGRSLTIDPKTERFVGDANANRLLRRECRKPFIVPEKV